MQSTRKQKAALIVEMNRKKADAKELELLAEKYKGKPHNEPYPQYLLKELGPEELGMLDNINKGKVDPWGYGKVKLDNK